MANLYPTDPEKALFVDELIDVVGDCLSSAPQNTDNVVKKELREKWADGKLKIFMTYLSKKVSSAGTAAFLVDGKLTVADMFVYGTLKSIQKGSWDFVPGTYIESWPPLLDYINFYESDPVVGPYKIA